MRKLGTRQGDWLISMLACISIAAALLMVVPTMTRAQDHSVTLSPAVVVAGSPELIRVAAPGAAEVDGEWLGRKIEFFHAKDGRAWIAFAGVDIEAPAGVSTLDITAKDADGKTRDLSKTVEIHEAHYRTETLTVGPRFVEPGPEYAKEIEADIALKQKVFAASAAEPEWSGDFVAPVRAQATDSFGVRRMFNGKLASVHKGMDFRAATGTPVDAANSGVVVLARPLYFEGNCVVIDHGLGLYTISMHLSRMDVREGERVTKGQQVGLSGATGRVTGPHLHWAVRWEGAYLDPAKVLRMKLAGVR